MGRSGPGQVEEAGACLSAAACGLPCLFESDVRSAAGRFLQELAARLQPIGHDLVGAGFATRTFAIPLRRPKRASRRFFPSASPTKDIRSLPRPAPTCCGSALPSSIWRSTLRNATSPDGSRTYAVDAGEATFAIEVRDSLTGQLLGRAVDRREAGEGPTYRRNYSSNLADFEALFDDWARIAARGLTELKSVSPVRYGRDPQAIAC